MKQRYLVIGGGGHAKVLVDALAASGETVVGIVDSASSPGGGRLLGVPVIGDDNVVLGFAPNSVLLVNALGSVGMPDKRKAIFEKFKQLKYRFARVIHPSAVIGLEVELGEGVQVMAGAVVQPGARIGDNTLINTRSSVDHDCILGAHVHVAPGATLSGGVRLEEGVHIGAGAVLIQAVRVGRNSIVAAGAVVVGNVLSNTKVAGIPAKEMVHS